MNWKEKKILITGGASFIGSHLVDTLIRRGTKVRVVDDLSSGKLENIKAHIKKKEIEFIKGDLVNPDIVKKSVKDIDYVFHLAAIHGGRGYVDMHQAACTKNLLIDTLVINQAYTAGVEKFVFASSACIYPNYILRNAKRQLYLNEDMAGPPYDPDNSYGWAKLTTEMTLRAYAKDFKMKSASCRFFTVYGERGVENHAIIALIARAFIKQDPYEIWGDGNQVRDWTYVGDIVEGMIRAAEVIDDGRVVNLGTMEKMRVIDAVKEIFAYTKFHPKIVFKMNMPTGPYNRVSDNHLAKKLLDWQPRVSFRDGLRRTIDWYFATKDPKLIKKNLNSWLTERI